MERAPSKALLAGTVAVAVLSVSTAAILFRLSEAPALVKAFWRLAFATLLLGAVALARGETRAELAAMPRRDWLGLALVGVVLAVHFASWVASLDLTTVAASVVLVTIHPVLVGVASARLFGERLPAGAWLGVAIAFAGASGVAFSDWLRTPDKFAPGPLLGDALALVGALAAAAYFLAGRGYRKRLSLLAYVVPVYAACSLALLVMALARGDEVLRWSGREYGLFVALAVVPMILGHTLLNFALKYVTAPVIATTILGEPVGSTLLAYFVLHEVPPALTLVGGALVLVGIGLVVAMDAASRRIAPAS